jgi:hypothetical protein
MANEKFINNLFGKLVGKKLRGKPRRIWNDNTRMSEKFSMKKRKYCQLSQDTVYWLVFLSTAKNFEYRKCVIPCPSEQMYSFQASPFAMNFAR